mmetsp:Transcript_74216/g.197940  ORF Transcript_74216/g.197940 Transcript_74216/m.197940 type:complete len:143 (+) Transcript_74216:31-459(+)
MSSRPQPLMAGHDLASATVPFEELSRLPLVLEELGFAVVTGVVSTEEVAALKQGFTDAVVALVDEEAVQNSGPTVQEVFETLKTEGAGSLPRRTARALSRDGFCFRRCLAHSGFAWGVRQNPRVRAAWEAVYPGETLVVSSD